MEIVTYDAQYGLHIPVSGDIIWRSMHGKTPDLETAQAWVKEWHLKYPGTPFRIWKITGQEVSPTPELYAHMDGRGK